MMHYLFGITFVQLFWARNYTFRAHNYIFSAQKTYFANTKYSEHLKMSLHVRVFGMFAHKLFPWCTNSPLHPRAFPHLLSLKTLSVRACIVFSVSLSWNCTTKPTNQRAYRSALWFAFCPPLKSWFTLTRIKQRHSHEMDTHRIYLTDWKLLCLCTMEINCEQTLRQS